MSSKLIICLLNSVEEQSIEMSKYCSYDPSTSKDNVITEEELLKQIEDEINCRKNDHSEDELAAVIGIVLMHYEVVSDARHHSPQIKQD